ncbi:TonB-dependent receptor [Alteriqipengyuania lutimaris]|uniref:TonB-dependent receptor n=1 Tax=Alteriqipengyuania lutimaris TaxID=1538146 RepID=A0A395LJF2_9SPHN|nr:TonB-dependent receptor [Alteriqipengyuania lutimaris]MBB3034708.1 iron complex outermembrane receptor protein [Alteriqipengyuania lutimaris]RDS76437.1 TonB-dependent receptor [Alteriqipengyuania lutimaris]
MTTAIFRLSLGSALIALAWAGQASAQETVSTERRDPGDDDRPVQDMERDLAGTIIVTAQRRTESLQDVPVTVTVFSEEEIAEARIQEVSDVVTRTPGLSFDAFPASQPRLAVRGIGSSDKGAAGDPSSAVFLDEIYLGRPAAVAFDAFDVQRIEVLKGPQGTLFGRNVVGGAINVITNRPEPGIFAAGAEFTYGNYDRLDGAGFINLPFGDRRAAVRASAAYRSHDGYVYNPTIDRNVDTQDRFSGRFQLLAEPTDTLRVHFTVDGTRDRNSGPVTRALELDPDDPLSAGYTVNQEREVVYGSTEGFQDLDTLGVRGEVNWDLPFATLTVLGSYRDLDYANGGDFDGGVADPASPGFNLVNIGGGEAERSEFSSQEVRLTSLPGGAIEWVVGLFHYNQQVERTDTLTLDSMFIAPIPLTEVFAQDASLDSVAAFADATVQLSDEFSILGGLRYSRDDKAYRVDNLQSVAPLRSEEFFDVAASEVFDDVTWRAGVNFEPSEDHLIYALVSSGFKSGGFQDNPTNAIAAATPFEPETATQYELGQKSSFADGRLIWNNTLFYLDYTNLQTDQVDPDTGASTVINAGKATIKGYETQLIANLFAGLSLSAAYAYTDATFGEFVENGNDLSGNRISRTPRHKVTVSPSYSYLFASGAELKIAADYRYESQIFDDNANTPPEIRDATHFLDARIVLDNIADRFSVSVWGKNLTDELTRTFQGTFLGANFGAYNPPRTYGVTLGFRY